MYFVHQYNFVDVDKCVDIFAVNLDKVTCLHDAVIQNHPEIARLLVKYGGTCRFVIYCFLHL